MDPPPRSPEPKPEAARLGMVRVIDESGEDYLYPSALFVPIDLPPAVVQALGLSA
jgi:hypothetical protein